MLIQSVGVDLGGWVVVVGGEGRWGGGVLLHFPEKRRTIYRRTKRQSAA